MVSHNTSHFIASQYYGFFFFLKHLENFKKMNFTLLLKDAFGSRIIPYELRLFALGFSSGSDILGFYLSHCCPFL